MRLIGLSVHRWMRCQGIAPRGSSGEADLRQTNQLVRPPGVDEAILVASDSSIRAAENGHGWPLVSPPAGNGFFLFPLRTPM